SCAGETGGTVRRRTVRSLEVVAHAELETIHVAETDGRLVRVVDQLAVDAAQLIDGAPVRVHRASRNDERRRRHERLANAPIVVEEIADVENVDAHLESILQACDAARQLL